MQAKVIYEKRTYWINIMSKFKFMSQEDVDREMLTWGKEQGKYSEKYELTIDGQKSVYTAYKDKNEKEEFWLEDEYLLIRDYEEKTAQDLRDHLGKTYLIESDLQPIKWKILNDIKEIQGYICMKAETNHPINGNKVIAWFTDKIKTKAGPESYYGLPGLILGLEFNDNDILIEASSVILNDSTTSLPIPKKMKGKKIDLTQFYEMQKAYIEETSKSKRNPYWQIRY